MQHSDTSSPYYLYYQSHFQNPNPTSNPTDPQFNVNPSTSPVTTAYASAPPVSYSDYSNYSSPYPSFPQNPGHVLNPPPTNTPIVNNSQFSASSIHSYSFPHLMPQPPASYAYDQNHTSLNYDHSDVNNHSYNVNPTGIVNPSHSCAPYDASNFPNYENPYENRQDFGGYGSQGMHGGLRDDFVGGGRVYKYSGGKLESYGDRGGLSGSSGSVLFDDYGRPINISNGKSQNASGSLPKIVRAIPKADAQEDVKNGVQKFRVKLLSEGIGQSDMDVLCQIGLDGIRILDPSTSRMLKIYPLETVTRCKVLDSYIFAFWSKSSIDIEPRRVRLKSNSYTTNNILDTVTAATFQLKEMGESNKPYGPSKDSEQASDKKKGFADWMNMMKPSNEETDHWVPDEAVKKCTACGTDFGTFVRRHHCRNCGDIFCDKCTQGRTALTADKLTQPVRVCDCCMAEVTQRLSNTKETAVNASGLQSHEDLAKKLQEVMKRNRTTSTGSKSDGYGSRMKEVECPTCTVHLQVQVPASGSETIECSVCQHPFLVSAH